MTMLELVALVQATARSDHEIVRRVRKLVNSGRVILCGSFAGRRI
jgi:hypothetical protein